jgi:hypothetical protein
MSLALGLASLLAAPPVTTPPASPPIEVSDRWQWRHCTRLSADTQLRSRPLSLEHESVVEKAFADCAEHLRPIAARQAPVDVETLVAGQRRLIRMDVEMFYWDIVAHRI